MSQGREIEVRRSRLSRLLSRIWPGSRASVKRPSTVTELRLQGLENRQLLAGDVEIVSAEAMGPIDVRAEVGSVATTDSGLRAESTPEGEPAPDLVQFAEDLAAAGVIFYGADWCPACTEQKQLFQDGGDNLPFIEVTNPDRSAGQIAIDNNVTAYPTWVFPDDSRETGVLTLQQLSDRSGVSIPLSEEPTFEDIGDQTVLIGSPLHVPVDAYDPNGGPLTVTVSVSDPSLLEAVVITGNRSIRIDMETYGDMVFELFEQRAPTAAGRVIELAEADFYDDIIFHRVIDDFVIQGGDPTGTGTSGSTLGDFDDDFHPELQHNRRGVLSFAKSSDDTNNSQFFITEVPTRFLDYNHSVFGQLIEGEDVRDAISEHAVNNADRPTTDIAINTIDVFTDTENSLVMLKATGNGVGSTNVTITVTDEDNNTHSETFQVDVNNDVANSQPYLNAVTVPDSFPLNTPAQLQMSSTDIEGDAVSYAAQVASAGTGATASIDQNGLLTVTPDSNFTGPVDVIVTVSPGPGVTGNASSDSDNQRIRFNFEGENPAPTSIDLRASSDTGASDTDNITNAGTLAFTVDGVVDGATVQLINVATGAVLGDAVASGGSVTVTTNNIATLGDGNYRVAARQVVGGEISELSPSVFVTYDSTAPDSVVGTANTTANVGRLYTTDLINSEEGTISYELTQSPSGASINTGSGVIEWTPEAGDVGDNDFTIATTDLAGNVRTETLTVSVAEAPVAEVRLVARDSNGDIITSLNVGDSFTLELVGVDARNGFERDGVYAIYADILFDSGIIRPVDNTIERVGDFNLSPNGTFADGLIDELGAASTRTVASNEQESVIARVEMEAIAAGTVNIRSEEADQSASEVLLFGVDDQIPAESVFYGNLSLTVGLNFTLNGDTATVAEDSGATTIDVLANDTTSGSSSLVVVSVDQPAQGGTVSVDSGVVSFTPDADFNGTTEFTYTAGDGSGAQDTATVTVTVTAVNDPPTGNPDTFNVIEGTSDNRLDVLGNDSIDPDTNETLTVTAVQNPSTGGTANVSSDGLAIEYTPPANFTGTETFTYTVSDGTDTSAVSVTVTVAPADNPPTAVDDSFTIDEDTAEAEYDILQNDQQDVDSQDFVIDSIGTPSAGGAARISADGLQFFYTPAADFFGEETITYTIRDTGGGLSAATVTFTVEAVNDAPPIANPTVPVITGSGEQVVFEISDLPTNVDGDGETLTFDNLGTPTAGGTVSIDSSGNIRYTPPSSTFVGTDTFTYAVSDGSGSDSTGTITIQVEDFTERNITLQFASARQASSVGIANVQLTGTDALGNTVTETPTISDDGESLIFANLLPGDYMVEVPAIPFFTGGDEPQQYSINSAADDGDSTIQSVMGRLKPEFLSIQDFLGSTPAQSVLVVVEPGASALIAEPTSLASESIVDPVVALNDAGTSLTITGKDDTDADVTASVLTTQGDVVQQRGQVGDLRLYRLNVSSDAVTYNTTSVSSGAEGELVASDAPEGEQATTPEDAVTEQTTGLAAAGTPEGEAVESATGVSDVSAAPLASGLLAAGDAEGEQIDEAPTEAPAELTPRLSRRGSLTSYRQDRSTPSADDSQSDDSESDESTSLSPEGVDRVLRRRF